MNLGSFTSFKVMGLAHTWPLNIIHAYAYFENCGFWSLIKWGWSKTKQFIFPPTKRARAAFSSFNIIQTQSQAPWNPWRGRFEKREILSPRPFFKFFINTFLISWHHFHGALNLFEVFSKNWVHKRNNEYNDRKNYL